MLLVALGCDSSSGALPQVTTYRHPGLGFTITLTGSWTTETDPNPEAQLNARSTSLGAFLRIAVCPNPKPELRPGTPAWEEYKQRLRRSLSFSKDGPGIESLEDTTCGSHPALQSTFSARNPDTGARDIFLSEVVCTPKEVYTLSISGPERDRQRTLSIFKHIAGSLSIPYQ
jgi:hypothetical protein